MKNLRKTKGLKYYWLTSEQAVYVENKTYSVGRSIAKLAKLLDIRIETLRGAFRKAHEDSRCMISEPVYKKLIKRFPGMGESVKSTGLREKRDGSPRRYATGKKLRETEDNKNE